MFKTDIPNKIKQPPVCCLNCGKSYIKKASLRKHEVTCELLYPNKHRRQIANIDDEEEVPSYRELFMMVRELGTKYKKLEKKIEEYERIVHREKRKINILEWLNKNQIPEYIFDNLESKIEINDILKNYSLVISDYSGLYIDFLLTNNPIIFAPFDYEKYITKDRELYYEYNEVTPGPKCKDWNEVIEWIIKFKNNSTLYVEERKKVRDRFHKYQDDKSCERVYNEIIKLDNK